MSKEGTRKNAPRNNKQKKSVASTSIPQREDTSERVLTSDPWPRPDHTPFVERKWDAPLIPHMTVRGMQKDRRYQRYRHGDPWGSHHAIFYNGLLRIEMAPTRFICLQTLQKMGIKDQVQLMLKRIGLGHIAYKTYPLFPELARQFFASAEIRYECGGHNTVGEGRLSYFSSGILYDISIRDLCDLYGFDRTLEGCSFPTDDFPHITELWNVIGTGVYESRAARLTHIRNPVVRVVAKILGEIFFAKEEASRVKKEELMLLHFGLPSFIRDIYGYPPPEHLKTNLGVIFAENLASKKWRALNTAHPRMERMGSLLTPIFMHHGIDLSHTPSVPTLAFFDEQFYKKCGIFKSGFVYHFQDRSGNAQYCKLPLPEFTTPTSRTNIEFALPPEHLMSHLAAPRRRGSSSRPATSQPHLEDDHVPDDLPQHGQPADYTEFIFPEDTGEYDLPPISAEATIEEKLAWLIDSQRKTHAMMRENRSMMQRIWTAVSRPRCPRPPSCFRAADRTDDVERTEPAIEVPDVAGHRTTADDEAGDAFDHDFRLSRRRRRPEDDHSGSSGDH